MFKQMGTLLAALAPENLVSHVDMIPLRKVSRVQMLRQSKKTVISRVDGTVPTGG